jgi:GNAT superfamily N-acetyltransferase
MTTITFEIVQDDNIEQCRELCNELMALQKSKAYLEPERFDAMNFDTRMKKSYEGALDKQVVVVKDNGIPVGYVFSTIDSLDSMRASPFQLLPQRDDLPQRIGCLSNLYLREKYRGTGLGSKLFEMSMDWLESFADIGLIYVFISNGNDDAYNFYIRHGFAYSHDVLGGFIKAASRSKKEAPIRKE